MIRLSRAARLARPRASKISARGLSLNTKTGPPAANFSCQSTTSCRRGRQVASRIDPHFALRSHSRGRAGERKISDRAVSRFSPLKNLCNSMGGSSTRSSDSARDIPAKVV